MKKTIFLLLASMFIGSFSYVKADDFFADETFSTDPFKEKSRDFGIIDSKRGEKKCHDICFKSVWLNADYSVWIWRHENSDFYEIKSAFDSDVSNFMAVVDAMGYGAYEVKYRRDGRNHVKFKCNGFVEKLVNDTKHMKSID